MPLTTYGIPHSGISGIKYLECLCENTTNEILNSSNDFTQRILMVHNSGKTLMRE